MPLLKIQLIIKRIFDLCAGLTIIMVLILLFLPIAIGIKLSSPGPIIFKQRRTGYKGHVFTCYKFRSMKVNDECDTKQATNEDPRKTKFGEFLRRTSLDELPQAINVIKGEMSIIGPRPHMLAHTEYYQKLIENYDKRHKMKPGITGWAQVNGFRGPTPLLWMMNKRVQHDIYYINNWSIALDIKILFKTILIIIFTDKNAI